MIRVLEVVNLILAPYRVFHLPANYKHNRAMFLDLERFEDDIHEEFICAICSGVLDDPEVTKCDHTFCSACIRGWLEYNSTCPIDRKRIQKLHPVSRAVKNVIASFRLTCNNAEYGCKDVVPLGNLADHLKTCEFDPNIEVACDKGCGIMTSAVNYKDHNCVQGLRYAMDMLEEKLKNTQEELADSKQKLSEVQLEAQQEKQQLSKIVSELHKQKQKFRRFRKSVRSLKGMLELKSS